MIARSKVAIVLLCPSLSLLIATSAFGAHPVRLKCEYLADPVGIDVQEPRLSWEVESQKRGQRQTAYRILVAGSREKLESDKGDIWDSGKVESPKSVNVPYDGRPLKSGERCYWKVRMWDRDGDPSPFSNVGSFEMALLSPGDWKAQWISMPSSVDFVAGRDGQAINFDGQSDTVRIQHYKQLKPASALTISAWVKPNDKLGGRPGGQSDDWREIYRKDDGHSRHLLAIGDGAVQFGIGIDGTYTESSAPVSYEHLKDGDWHLVTASYDGRFVRIHLDGAERGHAEKPGRLDTGGTNPAYIGSCRQEKEFFAGGIDDVRIYDRALSSEEIQALVRGAGAQPGLVGWWKFDGEMTNSVEGPVGESLGQSIGCPLLRTEIVVAKEVRRARARVSGLGWFELFINGQRVGNHVLDPVMSNYEKEVYYVTHDLEDYVRTGRNAIGVMLGNGWFSQPGRCRYGLAPVLLAQIDVEYTDGSAESFVSDANWKTSAGPIVENSIQGGETYDARLEKTGWATAGYDDMSWAQAQAVPGPKGRLCSQLLAPIRVVADLAPVRVSQPTPGVFVFDVGQVCGGWARVRLQGEAGTRVTLKYSERIFPDGLVDKRNHPAPQQTDAYVLKGDPSGEFYEPRYTFHPFRYVQIEGLANTPTLTDLVGRVVRTDVDLTGGFHCSSPLLNRISNASDWTVENSWLGVPVDCLHREPWAYLEPSETPSHLYGRKFMPQFWMKWLRDVQSEQRADGAIPVVIPNYPHHTSTDPAWSGNYPIAVWYLSQYYEDERLLAEHYDNMKRWVEFLRSTAEDNLIFKGTWGDHMGPGAKPGEEEYVSTLSPPPLAWTGYYYRDASILAHIAKLLGKPQDAEQYGKLAEQIKAAINAKWFDAGTANYAGGAQTSNAFALAIDIVPDDKKDEVVKNLIRDIVDTHGGRLTTGIIGVTSLVETLADHGGGNTLFDVVNRTDYPGWGYMIANGATTLWESWGQIMRRVGRREECMAMFTTVQEFFYSDVAGLHGPDFYGPGYMASGFGNVRICPLALGDLDHAEATIKTVRGLISSKWRRQGRSFVLEASIPANGRGTVSIPTCGLQDVVIKESDATVWRNDAFVSGVEGITSARREADYVSFDVGSGDYAFRLSGR